MAEIEECPKRRLQPLLLVIHDLHPSWLRCADEHVDASKRQGNTVVGTMIGGNLHLVRLVSLHGLSRFGLGGLEEV